MIDRAELRAELLAVVQETVARNPLGAELRGAQHRNEPITPNASLVWREVERGPRWGVRLNACHAAAGLTEEQFADAVFELLQRRWVTLERPELGYSYLVRT